MEGKGLMWKSAR